MSEKIKVCENEVKDIYSGFECFKIRFLENKKSIFSENQVFTKENLQKIIDGFAKNPDESDSSFEENKHKCHSNSWFDNGDTKFIVDGIDLSNLKNPTEMRDIVKFECEFIERISDTIKGEE